MDRAGNREERRYGWSDWLVLILMHLLVWGYMVQILVRPDDGWAFYFAAISMLFMVFALIRERSWFWFISVAFLSVGMMVLWIKRIPFADVWHYFGSTTNVVTLLILAPLFSIPITLGAYHRSALLIVRGKVRKPHSVFFVLTAFTYLLATLMNAAAIVAAYTTLHHLSRSFPKTIAEKMNDAAYCRGHVLAMIWSPVGAGLGVALSRVPADPTTVIVLGVGFSIFMLVFDTWMMKGWIRRHTDVEAHPMTHFEDHHISKTHWRRMGVFCGFIVVFVIGVIGCHEWFAMSVIDAVILLILLISLSWALVLKQPKRLRQELKAKWTSGMLGFVPQMMLFTSVGFFTKVMTVSGVMDSLVQVVARWSGSFGWLLIFLIVAIAVFSAQLGLFPALIVILLADLIPYEAMHLRPEWFVFAITAGAVGGVPASPLTVNVSLVANLMQKDPIKISRSNYPFAISILVFVSLITIGLSLLFPV